MIAGLLNILAIYDAYSGPLSIPISGRRKGEGENTEGEASADKSAATKAEKQASSSAADAKPASPASRDKT